MVLKCFACMIARFQEVLGQTQFGVREIEFGALKTYGQIIR